MKLLDSVGSLVYVSTLAFTSPVTAIPALAPKNGALFQTPPRIGRAGPFHQDLGVENFKFEWRFDQDVSLDVWSTLLNGLEGLKIIALRDSNARTAGDYFRLASQPRVSIEISPFEASTVGNDMARVCLYHILEKMISLSTFKKVEVRCYENDDIKARIAIDASPAATEAGTSQLSPGNTTNSIAADDTTLKAVTPYFGFLTPPLDKPIPTPVAVVTLMYALTWMGAEDKTAVVPRSYIDPGPRWDASIIFPSEGPVRTRPPYMEWRWAIETIGKVIGFFLQRRRFANMYGLIRVDGVQLDEFLFTKGKPWNAEAPAGNAGVATP